MHESPQSTPTAHSTHDILTIAAGPHSALGVPSVGAALARPAALYIRMGGIERLVSRVELRVPRAEEHEFADCVLVPTMSERELYWRVAAEINDALAYEPLCSDDREAYYAARFGGRPIPDGEPCARADIGDDCRCRACVERRVEQAEWTMGASREAATDALLREREGR